MKADFQDLSLGKQILLVFAGFVILAIVQFFFTWAAEDDISEAAKRTEAARELQLLPAQIAAASELYVKGDPIFRDRLKTFAADYEQKLNLLISKSEEEIVLDTADTATLAPKTLPAQLYSLWNKTSEKVQDVLYEPASVDTVVQEIREIPLNDSLNTITTETSQKVLTIANPKVSRANNYIQEQAEELAALAKRLTAREKAAWKEESKALVYIPLSFLGLTIALVLFLISIIYKKIYEPVKELDMIAEKVSEGDLSVRSDYTADNELGRIFRSIDKITDNLKNATLFINNIENGKLDEEFTGVDEKNVNQNSLEGALLNMRDQMKRVEEEEKERKWSTGGLAKFVDILRSNDDNVDVLGDTIISNLVKYTNSNQGGIYVLNDEESNQQLELISLYAFDTKKYDKKSYRPGEGLVGQTFRERETIYLLEVPHDYINIISGLGGANPKAILVVPLKVNEEIYGVIELASFNEYQKYEIEFVEKLAESIASTIAGVKNNQRTRRLLEESQALTEQMQAQEEEMRQNMEELSATQEEMSRKEVEMTAQLTAINNSLSTAEYDMNGTLINANNNYVKLLGYGQIDEISELPFTSLSNEDNSGLWNDLRNGVSQSGRYIKRKKSGAEVHVNATFTPVKNKNGELYKVIELILSLETGEDTVDHAELEHMKEVEEELRQNLEELEITQEQLDKKLLRSQSVLNSIDNVVKMITLDSDGTITEISRAAQKFLGFEPAELTGQPVAHIIEEGIISEVNPGQSLQSELTIKGKSGVVKAAATMQSDSKGDYIYLIWI